MAIYLDSAFETFEFGVDEDLEDIVVLLFYFADQVHVSARYDVCFLPLHLNNITYYPRLISPH